MHLQVLLLAEEDPVIPESIALFLALPLLRQAAHHGRHAPASSEGFVFLEGISERQHLSSVMFSDFPVAHHHTEKPFWL